MRGFKNFLMRGDVIVVAVGLVIALAFSALIPPSPANIINPIIHASPAVRTATAWACRSAISNTKTS